MTAYTVTADIRQLSGVEPGTVASDRASVWFWPFAGYSEDDYFVSGRVLKVSTVNGVATVELPATPTGNALYVQLRGVKGCSAPWLVQIPAADVPDLFDLPHIDPDTLDPITPPSPAWLAALEAVEADVETNTTGLATLSDTVAGLEVGAASDAAVATQVAEGALTGAAVDERIADGITGKADTATVNTALGLKADQTALAAEASTRSNADTTNANAISAETAARILGDAAPLVTKRTLGDITLANTGSGFADLDDSGTPNARNLDIIFPNVVAGQVVELELNALVSNAAGVAFLTFASIVAGAPVNRIHGTNTGGVAAWFCPASVFSKPSGSVPYTLQAGDIENGNARFRPQYKSAGTKSVYANSTTTYTLVVIGRGPKG